MLGSLNPSFISLYSIYWDVQGKIDAAGERCGGAVDGSVAATSLSTVCGFQ